MAGGRGHRLDSLKTRREAGGYSITGLAKAANVSDWTIRNLEAGGNCDPEITARIVAALAPPVELTSNSIADPTVVTAASDHGFQTGDTVTIAGVADSDPDINGSRVVTRINATTFSVPVNVTTGGTGGTATATAASVGQVAL